MTNEEILKKAIERADINGFNSGWRGDILDNVVKRYSIGLMYYVLIYNHVFAKAFWGEKEVATGFFIPHDMEMHEDKSLAWQYHLQQMVIEEEPLKYIEKFL